MTYNPPLLGSLHSLAQCLRPVTPDTFAPQRRRSPLLLGACQAVERDSPSPPFGSKNLPMSTTNAKLNSWVQEIADLTTPTNIHWCDGSDAEYQHLVDVMVSNGTAQKLNPEKRPESYIVFSRSRRRRPRRGSDLHLQREGRRRRPDQQLEGPRRDAGPHEGPVHRLHEGPDDVRHPLQHGSGGQPHRPHRRRDHGFALRGRRDAHHDPHGIEGARHAGRRRRVRTLRALRGCAARGRPGRRAVALQRRQQVHRALPRDARDLELRLRLRRQRPAGQEVLRAAHRLGDGARRGLARRAHADPQAHEPGRREALHRGRLPERLRQDEPRHARAHDPGLDGRVRRRRHRLDEVRR